MIAVLLLLGQTTTLPIPPMDAGSEPSRMPAIPSAHVAAPDSTDYGAARRRAVEDGVPLVIMTTAPECPPCDRMKEVLADWPKRRDLAFSIIPFDGSISEQLGVRRSGTPTFIVFTNPDDGATRRGGPNGSITLGDWISAKSLAGLLGLGLPSRTAAGSSAPRQRITQARAQARAEVRSEAWQPPDGPPSARADFIRRWGWVPSRRTRCNCSMCREAKRLYAAGLLAAGEWSEPLEAPQFPTPQSAVDEVIRFSGVGPGDLLVDLGAGDGRFVRSAAATGAEAIGVEIDPEMADLAKWHCQGMENASIVEGDATKFDVPAESVVVAFLWPPVLEKLPDLSHCRMVISHAHPMPQFPDAREMMFGGERFYVWEK